MNHPLPALPPDLAVLTRSFVLVGREADEDDNGIRWMSSGVCIAPGYLLTAEHVIHGGGEVIVRTCRFDRSRWTWRPLDTAKAVVMKKDRDLDLALLGLTMDLPRIVPTGFSDFYGPAHGRPIWRLGNDTAKVAGGHVHRIDRDEGGTRHWVSMPAAPGASGGPAFSAYDNGLVGLVIACQTEPKLPEAAVFRPRHLIRPFLADVRQLR